MTESTMNPFALPGPSFLSFFMFYGIAVCLLTRGVTSAIERHRSARLPPPELSDPYALAYLRGGAAEAARLTVFALIDRGLLDTQGRRIVAVAQAGHVGLGALEKKMLTAFAKPRELAAVISRRKWTKPFDAKYGPALRAAGLLTRRDGASRAIRTLALGAILGVALLKIALAVLAGRHNIVYLIVMSLAFSAFLLRPLRWRTQRGEQWLSDQRTLFTGLREQYPTRPAAASSDALWVAAAFGFGALPALAYPVLGQVFTGPITNSSISDSSSSLYGADTNSCSSGGSDSSGSSCSGGGSGCGGCGSGGSSGD